MASLGSATLLCVNNGIRYGTKKSVVAVLGSMLAFQIFVILSNFLKKECNQQRFNRIIGSTLIGFGTSLVLLDE